MQLYSWGCVSLIEDANNLLGNAEEATLLRLDRVYASSDWQRRSLGFQCESVLLGVHFPRTGAATASRSRDLAL